jgi:hypothetical protein
MNDRGFSHPNTGREVRIEQYGREVRLVFVCGTKALSDSLCEDLLKQLASGTLNLTLMGKPTSISEDK